MVDWQSPEEQMKDALAFTKLIYCLFGLYTWELLLTSGFEWSLITKRRKFTWPMVRLFFFLCRYCMLLSLIGLIISFNVTTKVNCKALYTFNSWTGNMAILCASTSLMIRTIAIWERRVAVIIPLMIFCIAHWALLYHGIIIVRANWDALQGACIVDETNPTFLRINFFFTMAFDLTILIFTAAALMRNTNRSGLWQLLFRDGLVYWGITFSVNAIPAVLNSLNLNTTMNIIATVPAATISAIAACRCVVRLQEYHHPEFYVNSQSVTQGTVDGRVATRLGTGKPPPQFAITRPEVQIVTDHITMDNLDASPTVSAAVQDNDSRRRSKDNSTGSMDEYKIDRDTESSYHVV